MKKKRDEFKEDKWAKYEESSDELYSYLKKKGKHKRAKESPTDKKF